MQMAFSILTSGLHQLQRWIVTIFKRARSGHVHRPAHIIFDRQSKGCIKPGTKTIIRLLGARLAPAPLLLSFNPSNGRFR
jgi:hypothetical protein